MASDNTAPATETGQNAEEVGKKAVDESGVSTQEVGKKPGDEPETSIEKILKIVTTLDNRFPQQPEQQRMSRSETAPARPTPSGNQQPTTGGLAKTQSDTTALATVRQSEHAIPKLKRNLRLLEEDVSKLQDLNIEVAEEVRRQIRPLDNLLKQVELGSTNKQLTEGNKNDLEKVNKKIFNLMCQVPLLPNKRKNNRGFDADDGNGDNHGKPIVCLPGIHANEEELKRLAVFRDVQTKFEQLDGDKKIYLLTFAVFPENQEVNRTMLMYWWIGEGILTYRVTPPKKGMVLADEDKPENVVKKVLKEFADKKLIEPVKNKRKVEPSSYKMTPFVHASLVRISMEMKLFNMYQKGEKPTMQRSEMNKVCLVEASSSQPEAKANKMLFADQIETVFNVSERFPDFTFKWFSKDQTSGKRKLNRLSTTTYKELKVFYLGRWERTAKRHIEVENAELMKNLKHMTKLKLLSFQGISRIERLDDAVCKLHDLIILDLRACYNLEKLPDKIDSLKALTYLDITDCYMIDRIPKRLSWLGNLEVLKGFVVSDATDEETVCTLAELEHLKNLRKLSISINKDVSVSKLFVDIENFDRLEKLKMAWGGINVHKPADPHSGVKNFLRQMTFQELQPVKKVPKKDRDPVHLPLKLKKLDLQCFPKSDLPSWLQPNMLGGLEKLYIKGGTELTGFGTQPPKEATACQVKVLRLKFLPRLKVEWRDLQLYFPRLEFLDKYQCPQVSFCPTDGIGIWRKKD
ncbi:PREDICTED: disease resistance RPP13-like protein 4 [Camelina sativa]|uniref:Disease resistance RPP13-like protein 4 n=1 Tax=Camelina sativa TaxID=90675 RepID=A0ABM0UIN8_CAMSA|nr:PREDICTED: disease resistance RPP13-like protein 4 [Camelina sativa]XP_010441708.1 PREDICTED: disease resistance RPP13-like protein 4 [Camelina sativa]